MARGKKRKKENLLDLDFDSKIIPINSIEEYKKIKSLRAETKNKLVEDFGCWCMLCNGFFFDDIKHYRIVWSSQGGDDSYENGALICSKCQIIIHGFSYDSLDVKNLNERIIEKKEIDTFYKMVVIEDFEQRKLKKQQKNIYNEAESMRSETRKRLIEEFDCWCMLCKKFFGAAITHHHIIWKSQGGDDSYENGSLLCAKCQTMIHSFLYDSPEVERLNEIILTKRFREGCIEISERKINTEDIELGISMKRQ